MSADLTSAIMNIKSAEMTSQLQYAVAAKMLKTANAQSAAILQLIEAAAESIGAATAEMTGASIDSPSGVDVYA